MLVPQRSRSILVVTLEKVRRSFRIWVSATYIFQCRGYRSEFDQICMMSVNLIAYRHCYSFGPLLLRFLLAGILDQVNVGVFQRVIRLCGTLPDGKY